MVSLNYEKQLPIGKEVIQSEINSLKKLKNSLNKDLIEFYSVIKCKEKLYFQVLVSQNCIKKNFSTPSLGISSFYVDAGSCSHGDGNDFKRFDYIISHSGKSELKNIIQYVKRNKSITLVGVTSKKIQFYINLVILNFTTN